MMGAPLSGFDELWRIFENFILVFLLLTANWNDINHDR